MNTKVMALNAFVKNVISKDKLYVTVCEAKGVEPSINNYFDSQWVNDYPNEMYAFLLFTSFYQNKVKHDENHREKITMLTDFETRYPDFRDYYPMLSEDRKEKVENIKEFTELFNTFVGSNEMQEMTLDELYLKLLDFQYRFYMIIGTQRFEELASKTKVEIDGFKNKTK